MRICLDARPLEKAHAARGVGNVVRNLLRAMGRIDEDNDYTLLTSSPHDEPLFFQRECTVPVPQLPRYHRFDWIVDQVLLPGLARRSRADLVFATDFTCYPRLLSGRNVVAMVYDQIPFLFPHCMAEQAPLAQWGLRFNFAGLRRMHRLIAISEATRKDTVRLFNVPPERITVVYPGIDHTLFNPANVSQDIRDRYGVAGEYFIYVGDPEWRKNLRGALEAFAGIPESVKLVIVGRRAPDDSNLRDWLLETGTAERVFLTGYVPDEDLPSLYGYARGLLFPSRYEGFGLPVAEAMACGCPVITSDNSSLPEVAGDAALYVDPENADDIRGAMMALLQSQELTETVRRRGLDQARQFTWERSARETLAVLQESDHGKY